MRDLKVQRRVGAGGIEVTLSTYRVPPSVVVAMVAVGAILVCAVCCDAQPLNAETAAASSGNSQVAAEIVFILSTPVWPESGLVS